MNMEIIDDIATEIKESAAFLKQYAALNRIEIAIERLSCVEVFLNKCRRDRSYRR